MHKIGITEVIVMTMYNAVQKKAGDDLWEKIGIHDNKIFKFISTV